MAAVTKIDSNITGLRFAEETSLGNVGTLADVDWYNLEPNSYSDFGGQVTTLARNPINDSRQRKKGVITDLDASGGFNHDLTQENLQRLLQGFFFADFRTKDELACATVTDGGGSEDSYTVASGGDGYVAGDLVFGKGFDDAANNMLRLVTGTPTGTEVTVATGTLTAATSQMGTISRVGFQFGSGDAEIDASGTLPRLTTTTKDCTEFGLIPGEWVYIGNTDAAATAFAEAANTTFARVRSVGTNFIEFDKAEATLVTDDGSGKTVQIFFGRVLKNELGTLIKRRTYNIERTLGAPDDASLSDIQSEYLVGAIPNELTLNVNTADKLNIDLSFVATDNEQRTSATGPKSATGTIYNPPESGAFNTSSDISRVKLSSHSNTDEAPTALFAFAQDLTISINNNVSPNKAVGVLGAFEVTAGTFEVGGNITAYFADVAAVSSVRSNADITLDIHAVKDNAGISLDMPLISLGDGRANVEQDQPITIPLTNEAATGAGVVSTMDHTLLMVFFDYLPDDAE